MPKDDLVRTTDNYAFYIKWAEIVAKIDAFNVDPANAEATNKLSGVETVERIKAIIDAVYPGVEITTDKDLVIECLKSEFAEISREKFVFEDGKILSICKDKLTEEETHNIEKIISPNIKWIKIRDIKESKNYTYDLSLPDNGGFWDHSAII